MEKSTSFLLTKFLFLFVLICMFIPSQILAQMQEIPLHRKPYKLSSGSHIGDQSGEKLVFSAVVQSPGAPWLSIHFGTYNLGQHSYIIMTSLYDNKWQRHNQTTLDQWYNYSAFFNGDAVKIELYVVSGDRDIFFSVDELVVGEWYSPTESQCGPTDDRIASSDPAVGRIVSIGCTGWIIPNGSIVTAGHCLDATTANILEFNVPLSNPNGTIVHPGPEDQYSIDQSSRVFVNGGIGNDFGVCKVFPNTVTSLMPREAQGAYFTLVQDLNSDPIRITGYGVDGGTANQTQQTNSGPNAGSSGTTMRYVVDTEGGNSGSPVIDENTHFALGVHTHGGCTTSGGNNSGTSFYHTDFWEAVEFGSGGCGIALASDPVPAGSSTDVSIDLAELSWTNGSDALSNELYFGTDTGALELVQSGSLASSWTITSSPLNYGTTYYWQVVEIGDTCSSSGPIWNFTTEANPNQVAEYFYPQNADYWTGSTDGNTKTDNSEVRTIDPEMGWMTFDISSILPYSTIDSVRFHGFVNATYYPYWSATPMGNVNPVTDNAAAISSQLLAGYNQNTAYIYQDEPSSFAPGWHSYSMLNGALSDLQTAVDNAQGWFAIGLVDRDFSTTYYINFDGWAESNPPYIEIKYVPIPVELSSFRADVNVETVMLSWITATETNNSGFEVQRNSGSEYETLAFVQGNGTATETHSYSYVDKNVLTGKHQYRLKQVDYDGSFEYSNIVDVEISSPLKFSLDQNYPNPFNPTTRIKYSIPTTGFVTLKVYDLLGREAALLVNEKKQAGIYDVEFNASSLSSGVYIYKLTSGNFIETKKLMLLK